MAKKKTAKKKTAKKKTAKNILVVGDWVIDDDWFVGANHSRTSSVPPNVHFDP